MNNYIKSTHLSLVVLLIFGGCQNINHTDSANRTKSDESFSIASLEEVGANPKIIREIVDDIESGFFPKRHSLLIYKDRKLVLEKYFKGQDYNWGRDLGIVDHGQTVLHDMRSVSKSIVSACVGIAIDQGKIKSVNQKVFDFFNDYKAYSHEGKAELTIKHLLTMTSGLEWNEDIPYDNPENSEIQMDQSGDRIGFILSRKLVATPGTTWNYNGGTTELLAAIIKRATGQNVYEFAKEHLFEPLGITNSEWINATGTDDPAAASGLRLTSRDMLKFGHLYLNDGLLETKQIIPKNWVEASLKTHITFGRNKVGYGYQFWIFQFTFQDKSYTLPTAVGNGDQRIFIDKSNDLIVATTAGNYNIWNIEKSCWWRSGRSRIFYEYIKFVLIRRQENDNLHAGVGAASIPDGIGTSFRHSRFDILNFFVRKI